MGGRWMELAELLGVGPGITAIIGSGGKTTTLYQLARELTGRGLRVICSTTTHIRPPDRRPDVKIAGRKEPTQCAQLSHG